MIRYSYLSEQFADCEEIWKKIKAVVVRGDFTLGAELGDFERDFAALCNTVHAIGVGNGTDALELCLLANDIRGEVITTPYSFIATTGAIVNAGATPVFADIRSDFNIDPTAIEAAITPRTEAIMPVHWAGRPCDMSAISEIAARHGLLVIEDCAHAAGGAWAGKQCGSWGRAAGVSLHPLKTINVWGDGGVIVTSDDNLAAKLRLKRNHGLATRDTITVFGRNSRLATVQAVVAHHILAKLPGILAARKNVSEKLDAALARVDGISRAPFAADARPTYYLYSFLAERRDQLRDHLIGSGVECKVHYPVPIHLQPAAAKYGHKKGSFPVAERCADNTLTLPAHDFITDEEIVTMGRLVKEFYGHPAAVAA